MSTIKTPIDKDLFGGAIVSRLPDNFADISQFREVPDHQEVFVENESDASIIIELFDYDSDLSDDQAIRHYFDDLAKFNEAVHYVVHSDNIVTEEMFAPLIPPQFTRIALIGQQSVSKFRDRPDAVVDEVYVILVLIRLKNVGTDLLVSLNIPIKDEELAQKSPDFDVSLLHINMLMEMENCDLFQEIYTLFPSIRALKSFVNWLNIRDWSLFGGETTN
jgi:hypothetical protein